MARSIFTFLLFASLLFLFIFSYFFLFILHLHMRSRNPKDALHAMKTRLFFLLLFCIYMDNQNSQQRDRQADYICMCIFKESFWLASL